MNRSIDRTTVLRKGGAVLLGLVLIAALAIAADQAFATKRVETVNESTFHLGHVSVKCLDARVYAEAIAPDGSNDEAPDAEADEVLEVPDPAWPLEGEELTMGVPRTRSYVLINEGETAFVRLASHTVFGELVHINNVSVEEPQEEDAEDAQEEAENPLWRFASDGFWYRRVPLQPGERIVVSVSVQVPFSQEWVDALSTGESSEVIETIQVEGMQARNSTVNMQAAYPWGEPASGQGGSIPDAGVNEGEEVI